VGELARRLGVDSEAGQTLQVGATFPGSDLVGTSYQHPLYDRVSQIVAGGDYITADSGTGLVHTAPGHGQEDYLTGLKYGLPLLSPVNNLGRFTEEAGPRFEGLDVLGDGNIAVIDALREVGALIKQEAYNHKYPYDWRTKKPTIFRATEQWFASVSSFREAAMTAIDGVKWIPAIGRNRIGAMTESRGDWCISRQRSWGVPIPVFYSKRNNEPLITKETVEHIAQMFEKHGSNAWWELEVAELLPEGPLRDAADDYTRGSDTMDVWFDSGTSWAGVARQREALSYPADIYLEGSDQHRGWFQSSLLTSVATQGIAPYKTVLTHGFVLDEKGFKMSKSLGNVVSPRDIIEGGPNQKLKPGYGADTLRLWVSGVDYSGDVCLGANIMKQVFESCRKLRNTLRYLIGNLNDFDVEKDMVPIDQLPSVDRYILGRLSATMKEIETAYDDYQFYKVTSVIFKFAVSELSAFYLDISKDRLYISSKNDFRRRSCQTVMRHLLEQLVVSIAPIVPHLAEDVWLNLPYPVPCSSVFQKGWMTEKDMFPTHEEELWSKILLLRDDVNKVIEQARQEKVVGTSQEMHVFIHSTDKTLSDTLQKIQGDDKFLSTLESTNSVDDLRFVLMTSRVSVVGSVEDVSAQCETYFRQASDSVSGMSVGVKKISAKKCERCWYYSDSVGDDHDHPEICARCASVIHTDGYVV